MRNLNNCFSKNAICRFVNEASRVLRAISDPALHNQRLVQLGFLPRWAYSRSNRYRSGDVTGAGTALSMWTGSLFEGRPMSVERQPASGSSRAIF
jgi:hypothetical protein